MDTGSQLKKAYQYIQKGKLAQAQAILKDLLADSTIGDAEEEAAWFALVYTVSTRREKLNCLRQTLRINPDHAKAKKWLAALQSSHNSNLQPPWASITPKDKPHSQIKKAFLWTGSAITGMLLMIAAGVGIGLLLYQVYVDQPGTKPVALASFLQVPGFVATAEPLKTSSATPTPSLTSTETIYFTSTATPTLEPTATQTITLTRTASPSPSPSPTATLTNSPFPTQTLSPTPSETPTLTFTPTITVPPSALITGITGSNQSLPLSCEANAAVDWAAYFGFKIKELEFFSKLPVSDDPDVGFVGNVNGDWGQIPPNPYGIHAGPVADLLIEYGIDAVAVKDFGWENLQREIALNHPVVVWIVGHVWTGIKPVNYTASDGYTTVVAPYEHTVIFIGYDQENVTILDGKNIYTRSIDKFLASWGTLGSQAIIYQPTH